MALCARSYHLLSWYASNGQFLVNYDAFSVWESSYKQQASQISLLMLLKRTSCQFKPAARRLGIGAGTEIYARFSCMLLVTTCVQGLVYTAYISKFN